jgi:hypothetical protein
MFVAQHADAPWGDQGDILVHGMSLRLGRREGSIQLERTGPFVPPISLPGMHDVIVSDPVRRALASSLPRLVFRPVVKARIVRLEWERWELVSEVVPDIQQHGRFDAAAYGGQDFVCADPMVGYGYLSARLTAAMEKLADRWVRFVPAR